MKQISAAEQYIYKQVYPTSDRQLFPTKVHVKSLIAKVGATELFYGGV